MILFGFKVETGRKTLNGLTTGSSSSSSSLGGLGLNRTGFEAPFVVVVGVPRF